jgi:hypothetical protein
MEKQYAASVKRREKINKKAKAKPKKGKVQK